MPRSSHPNRKPPEVIVMFEPHRLQQDLLHTAYAFLVPEFRRQLPRSQTSSMAPQVRPREIHAERHGP
jgi:hypothetical protein